MILPLQFPDIWDKYKVHETLFWTAEDLAYDSDSVTFAKLKPTVQEGIKKLMAFNALSEASGAEQPMIRATTLLESVQSPEARSFFGFQLAMETIYKEVHCHLYEQYSGEKNVPYTTCEKVVEDPTCIAKIEWLGALPAYRDDSIPFDERLLVGIIEKTIFFGASNLLKCWAKNEKVLPALVNAFSKMNRDNWFQASFAADLSNHLNGRVPEDAVKSIVEICIEIEYNFLCHILPLEEMKISNSDIKMYLRNAADEIFKLLHWSPKYKTICPIDWLQIQDKDLEPPAKPAKAVFPSQRQTKESVFAINEDF